MMMRREAPMRLEVYKQKEVVQQTAGRLQKLMAEGLRVVEERSEWRRQFAGRATEKRYQDMAFRVFRNDAIRQYRSQLDLASRYVYLAATAYDYEANQLGEGANYGRAFLTEIVRQRAPGVVRDGVPVPGVPGLADHLARMSQNFKVLKTQMGFNNPQTETGRFSLRSELMRLKRDATGDNLWKAQLKEAVVADLWKVPEFRRFARPMAPESAGPQPAIVLKFPTTVTFGLNFFGWPLAGGDSAYDPSQFATKIRSAGVWFDGYNGNGLSITRGCICSPWVPTCSVRPMDGILRPASGAWSTRSCRSRSRSRPSSFGGNRSSRCSIHSMGPLPRFGDSRRCAPIMTRVPSRRRR